MQLETAEQRKQLINDFANFMAKTTVKSIDTLRNQYSRMTDGELVDEVTEFAPFLLA